MNHPTEIPAFVILNASRDSSLLAARAKALNDAGYYTSSVRTPEDAIAIASQVKCAVAIICRSFTFAEQQMMHTRIQAVVPSITVIFLGKALDDNPDGFLSAIRAAIASREDASRMPRC